MHSCGWLCCGILFILMGGSHCADAFMSFEEGGLENREEIARIGKKFKTTFLETGGGEHPAEVFRAFRGRDPSINALLRHRGLIKE